VAFVSAPKRRPYRFLPHTADVAVAVRAATLPALFGHAASALFDLTTDRRSVRPRRRARFEAQGVTLENLLVRFLSELLYLQEVKGWRFHSCRVTSLDRHGFRVRAVAAGEPFDPERHPRRREVKAITYHQLAVRRRAGVWRVRFVLDV
jgi:SHS2 domain-containing protein